MTSEGTPARIIHEVDCTLDQDIVADFDAWLPGHVRAVLACGGFLGATVHVSEVAPGEPRRRRIVYELASEAALDHYLENDAPRLLSETEQRFGAKLHCERRKFQHREDFVPDALAAQACRNCGAPVRADYCSHCGQARDTHVPTLRELAGDVTHSLLHLDGRVWRTLRALVLEPGELTRAFIAGRRQQHLPPFRLYLAASILYFALTAVLPQAGFVRVDASGQAVPAATVAEGGRQLLADFTATAPRLMFLFLPLVAAVALPFYRRPRRLYVEHLVLFLHNHALLFLTLALTTLLDALALALVPLAGVVEFANLALLAWLLWYLFRSMRVVYGEGRGRTLAKFAALTFLYLLLLGITMAGGMLYSLLRLA